MQNTPRWQKILIGVDLVCVISALVALSTAIWMRDLERGTEILLRFVSWAAMGVHFVLRGVLNWEQNRWLAIIDISVVAFGVILILLAFLR